MKRHVLQALAALLLISLSACAPRGETSSLTQILEAEKNRYRVASQGIPQSDVGTKVTSVSGKLQELETLKDAAAVASRSSEVAELLSDIVPHAGYTSRPALSELMTQYRMIGTGTRTAEVTETAQVRLLVSRTYSALASELESTKFAL